jgi:hypothetical protein
MWVRLMLLTPLLTTIPVNFWGGYGQDVYTPHFPFLPSFLLTLNKERSDRQATHLPFFDKFATSSGSITLGCWNHLPSSPIMHRDFTPKIGSVLSHVTHIYYPVRPDDGP